MKRWRILHIGEMEILLHPAVLPVAVYAFLSGYSRIWVVSSLSILVHESAHAVVAAIFQCAPSAIELTPLGAVMLLEDDSKLPLLKRMIMLLAGPVISMGLAGLAVWMTKVGWIASQFGAEVFLCNIAIFMINLLPVLPLDGGRMLYFALDRLINANLAAKVMCFLGVVAGLGLIVANIVVSVAHGGWNLSLAFAGCSILYSTSAAMMTSKLQELRTFMDRKIVLERRGWLPCKVLCVLSNQPLCGLIRELPRNQYAICAIVEPGSQTIRGFVDENQMIQHYLNRPGITMIEALTLSENTKETAKYDTI